MSRMIVTAAFFAVAAVAGPSPAVAQFNDGRPAVAQTGTSDEQAACRRDTRRLCRHVKAGSGNNAFLECLQAHRAKLSQPCRQVLELHGM